MTTLHTGESSQEPAEKVMHEEPEEELISVAKAQWEALTSDRDKFEAEAKSNFDRVLRVSADLENANRRNEREKSDLRKFGTENLVKDLLPMLDSFEKAFVAIDDSSEEFAEFRKGFELVYKQCLEILEQRGLESKGMQGETFDPNMHNGIKREESENVDVETIDEVYSKGYTLNGRLLRPAMVSVLVPA
jgi:molecular chaperone GrpE